MTHRRPEVVAGLVVGAVLLTAYVSTLAPDVTFWDSGEFIAAARHFGIPHPPGTPLFVAALNAFARLWFFLPFAVRTNLFSAVCTAAAAGLSCAFVARVSRDWMTGAAAALIAGTMSTVWQNANETEVYAAALLLSIGSLVAADWTGRTGSRRGAILTAYLLALTVPLHLSALVAAPAAIYLATRSGEDEFTDWSLLLILGGAAVLAAGAGLASWPIATVAVVLMYAGAFIRGPRSRSEAVRVALAIGLAVVVAVSATLILLVRARFDPAINQANPSTLAQMAYAISRRQYEVAGMWPRQVPVWLQLANWFEYADWQFALSLAPEAVPSVGRILVTLAFAALGIVGCVAHRASDRRTWRAILVLFLSGSVGVIAYVNFKAGASFAWSILSDPAKHEARDRDYFFVLGFWAWGLWAGIGAAAVARRFFRSRGAALAFAAVPLVLNWDPCRRNERPESELPRMVGRALLEPLPPRAVLFVAGDNDTYPLWFLQQVDSLRTDVTIVTIPLLGAPWYRDEMRRRWRLETGERRDVHDFLAEMARSARTAGRPVAVALTVPKGDRDALGRGWEIEGLVAVQQTARHMSNQELGIDAGATRRWAQTLREWRGGRAAHPATDPVSEHFLALLDCPNWALSRASQIGPPASLDSLCNLR